MDDEQIYQFYLRTELPTQKTQERSDLGIDSTCGDETVKPNRGRPKGSTKLKLGRPKANPSSIQVEYNFPSKYVPTHIFIGN